MDDHALPTLAALPYLCGVSTTRYGRGLNTLEEAKGPNPPPLLTCLPFLEAFQTEWPTDAHFVGYHVEGNRGVIESCWPRVNKAPIVQEFRLHGGDLKSWCFIFDWDTKSLMGEKTPIDESLTAAFWDLLAVCPEWSRSWSYAYASRNGTRLVYILKDPLPVERAEALHKHLTEELRGAGLEVDRLSAWNHPFRMPRVVREDKNKETGQVTRYKAEPLWERWQDQVLDVAGMLGTGALSTPVASAPKLALPKPTPEDALLALGQDRNRPSWWKEVNLYLRPAQCYTTVYHERVLATEARDTTIQRFVGEICVAIMRARKKGHNVGPIEVYALLLSPVQQLEPDNDTPDWTDELWEAVLKYWAKELQKAEQEVLDQQTQEILATSIQERILEGMRSWIDHPEIREPEPQCSDWASQHFLVATPSGNYYVMGQDGFYDSIPVRDRLLPTRIRELGMEPMIPLGYMTEKGWRKYPITDVIDRHATVVQSVEGHAAKDGNWIRNLRGDWPTFCLRLYRRREDLKATYCPEVDEWLKKVGGDEENYWRLRTWIGHALAFDEGPIAALALAGSAGIGKKLLALGLAECVGSQVYADSGDMGKYAENLLKSPFMVINEGLKIDKSGYDPADIFRIMTGGDPIKCETKFKDKIEIRAPIRVIVTANNEDVISMLAGRGRNLSLEDKEALAQRLVIVRVNKSAAQWLRAKGGLDYTRGWVSKDSGGRSSDFRVAKHFMWLYENRPRVVSGSRLLMEGTSSDEVIHTLSTRSGGAPAVIEALVGMVQKAQRGAIEGMVLQTKRHPDYADVNVPAVWVTVSGVINYLRTMDRVNAGWLRHSEVQKIYKSLVPRSEPAQGRNLELPTPRGQQRAYWHLLDLRLLLHQAYDLGYPCDVLESLVAELDKNTVPINIQERRA